MVHEAGIKGSGWHVAIGGFRGVSVADVDELLRRVEEAASPALFQLFDADRVVGWRHLFFAAVNAVKAFEGGAAISRSLEMEALLYASCQDQISQALEVVGISSESNKVGLLVLGRSPEEAEAAFERISGVLGGADDSVLEINEAKFEGIRSAFGVSDVELEAVEGPVEEALTWLVVERGALLPLRR
ncbi:MAG: KEOPS complex subunit Cgi121 [Candidatus Bathyarchaeota archaeon]|nr:KEOPS complex subunit Cgi121 [Candidatus Bathyarchaeota archaeon]